MGLPYEVTRDDLQKTLIRLKEALYNHQQWYGTLVRALVCKLPADKHDTSPDAYKECRFGQWYYSNLPETLLNHPGFIALGEVHQRMHHLAGQLLLTADTGNPISTLDYDNFSNALERLRLEISALEQELEDSLFNHDSLTGAIARSGILPLLREQQELQELLKRHAQSAGYIAMLDLDHFKNVNDLHGHLAGDKVLIEAVHYLIKHLRPYDKVFRYGGEEFLLYLPSTDLTPCHERIEELRNGLAAMDIDIDEEEPIHITASFGLTLLDADVPVETSIDRADKAMYAAKSAGRNCVRIWDSTMQ